MVLLHARYYGKVHFRPMDIIFYFVSRSSGHEHKKENESYPNINQEKSPRAEAEPVHTGTRATNLTEGEQRPLTTLPSWKILGTLIENLQQQKLWLK